MIDEIGKKQKNKIGLPLLCILLAAGIGVGVYFWSTSDKDILRTEQTKIKPDQTFQDQSEKTYEKITRETIIDYDQLSKDEHLQSIIRERKDEFGMDKGVDVIVKADESFKVGDVIIPMRDILEKLRIRQGNIIEESISKNTSKEQTDSFGIYVVKPNDNLWNIHFRFLKDYFDRRNVSLSPLSDKPDEKGFSSGVGKILKFSENIVYIYSIRDQEFEVDLNLLYPNNEIVIFHMEEIFSFLDQIDLENVDNIRFDGQNLWISSTY